MPKLPLDDSSIAGAAADPGRSRVAPYKVHGGQTFAVTSAPAVMPIADPVESPAFLDHETTDQLDPGRGTLRGAAMSRTLLERASRQLELLALRSLELADRVAAGEIAFLDAVDIACDAAVWSGLTSTVGDDIVQATLAAAFANARSPT
jgi:hypothetical protein